MSSAVPLKRLRVSIWVGNIFLDDDIVAGGDMIVDDLTMISTIVNTTSNQITYEKLIDAERTAREVAACHKHHIQCLAGFALTSATKGERTVAFETFLNSASDAQIDAMAKAMVDKIDEPTKAGARTPQQLYDGIGFDNENLDGKNEKTPLVKFYRAVAAAVTKPSGCGGRFVSVAAAPLSSPTMVVLPKRLPAGSKGSPASQMMLNHPYEMSAGLDNLVVRPMCYDTFTADPATPKTTRAQWHADVLDYAVGKGTENGGTPATRASVFQMGFKNAMGFHNDPANKNSTDGGRKWQNLDGIVDPGKEMEEVCWRMRQAGVGIVLFAFPDSSDLKTLQPKPRARYLSDLKTYFASVARYNYVLNGAASASGPDWDMFDKDKPAENTCKPGPLTQPAQVPLGADGRTRLGKP
jgi:hypothetical protein